MSIQIDRLYVLYKTEKKRKFIDYWIDRSRKKEIEWELKMERAKRKTQEKTINKRSTQKSKEKLDGVKRNLQ